jgi:hypothetical protein
MSEVLLDQDIERKWHELRSDDLLMMPFDPLMHVSDHYELALIELTKRRWHFSQIFFLHFFWFSPACEIAFLPPPMHGHFKDIVLRQFVIWALFALSLLILHVGLGFVNALELFPMLASVFGIAVALLHLFLSWDRFRYWMEARNHLGVKYLKSLFPHKDKPTKKKSKGKTSSPKR